MVFITDLTGIENAGAVNPCRRDGSKHPLHIGRHIYLHVADTEIRKTTKQKR